MRPGGANNPSPYGGITRIKSSVEARRSLSAFRLPFGCAFIFAHAPDNPARAVLGKKGGDCLLEATLGGRTKSYQIISINIINLILNNRHNIDSNDS